MYKENLKNDSFGKAHAEKEQKDKAGAPYILHPLRMMLRMEMGSEMIAAVLHDVVEDTGWTFAGLRQEGFPEEVIEAVDCLTQRVEEPYESFINRIKTNPIAIRVKIADLEDNIDVKRIQNLTERDMQQLNNSKVTGSV